MDILEIRAALGPRAHKTQTKQTKHNSEN